MKWILKQLLTKAIIFGAMAVSSTIAAVTVQSATGQIDITNPSKRYTCSFYNYDDTLLYITQVEPTHDAVYRGNLPTKPQTDEYTFVFSGWDNQLAQITKDTSFHALFEMKKRDFTVKFVNYDGTILYETTVQSGDSVHYPYENPTRPSDEQYGYAFTGWDEDTSCVTKDTSFVAQYEKTNKTYKVYYFNYDETLLYTDKVYYGQSSTYKGPNFSGPSANQGYQYRFKEWSDSTNMITSDKAVIAIFELERVKYSVTFFNYDSTVLYVDEVFYGDTATYRGPVPYHQPDEEYSYIFAGWDKQFEIITENTAVYAQFIETNPDCKITFKNWDDTILDVQTVKYGSSVEYHGEEEPFRPENDKYIYEFVSWDRDTSSVTSSFDVYPIFNEYLKTYTVTYLNYDEEELQTAEVPYGYDATNSFEGVPTRPDDDFYTYTFKEWSEDLSFISGDITVVAIYEATPLEQNKGDSEEGTGGEHGDHGHPECDPMTPTEGVGEKATVSYLNWDSTELDFDGVLVGRPSKYDSGKPLPTRPDDKKHKNYVFCSWDQDLSCIEKNIATFAQYVIKEDIFDKYIVTFRNGVDGSLIYECVCEENEMPVFPDSITPTHKPGWVFVGWDRALVRCTQSYTVYAKFMLAMGGGGGGGDSEAGEVAGDVSGDFGFEPKNKTIGTLFTSYTRVIYLRERSFGDFSNNKWLDPNQYSLKSATFSPLNLTSDLAKQTNFKEYTADIKFIDNELRYYTPTPMYNSSFPRSLNDDAYSPIVDPEYSFNYVPFELSSENYNKLKEKKYTNPDNISYAADYSEYVKQTYLTLNDEEKEFFTGFAKENDLSVSSISDIINVKTFISEYCTYNLNAESYPDDANYAIYFLKEAKEGICNNFATALTLLYRSMGIPARFTVGYIVKPADNGYEREINTKYAHAWTEIYLDNIGWVYVDGTGGSNNVDGESGDGEGQTITNQYNPFGSLDSDDPILTINVDPQLETKVYDGEPMKVAGSYVGEFLNDGDYIMYNICEEKADVGTYITRCMPRIYSKDGKDVTKQYIGKVKINYKSYSIIQRTIEVKTGSALVSRVGLTEPLKCTDYTVISGSLVDGHFIRVESSSSISLPGATDNIFEKYKILSYDEVDDVYFEHTSNYRIIWHYGTLTVK